MLAGSFEGVGQGFSGPQGSFTDHYAPPDTNASVGPNHFVEIVNSGFAVFNKSGTPLYGPVPTNTLWAGFGGLCQQDNDGDATVKYDQFADRWVIQQLAISNVTSNFYICVAVSTSPDPTGSYYRYAWPFANFPDYPKLSVWPDAYYLTINQFDSSGNSFLGPMVSALDRTRMLAGSPASMQWEALSTAYGSLLPSDVDGSTPPPAGSPGYFLALDASSLDFWRFHVDWSNVANSWVGTSSTAASPTQLPVAAYSTACGGTNCIPQGGTSTKLAALDDRLMYRLAYRNFGDHESPAVIELGLKDSTDPTYFFLDDVAINAYVPAPNVVQNPGFETGNLTGWTDATPGHPPVVVTGVSHSGVDSAQLGTSSPYNGDSTLTQTVIVPSGNPTLTFWYQPHCPDTITYDQIGMQIRSTSGTVLATVLNVCSNSGAWTEVSFDMTPYAGQTVVLWFNDHDDGYSSDPTYFYIDDIAIG